jgi:pimeloyl-ACP methyl ester carboxylesterase
MFTLERIQWIVTMTPFARKVIRALFGLGERVAPTVAGRVAFELFCRTPNVNRPTDGERRAVERAAGFMAEARHHRLKTSTGCVAVHEFRPEPGKDSPGREARGSVLVIHGWRSRTEYMRPLIEGFRAAGYRTISLDLPGHGGSLGRRLHLVSALEAARTAADWFGPFRAIVGHSFGGVIAANAAVASVSRFAPVATDRLVLVAAPSSLQAIFDDFSAMLNVGPRSQAAMAEIVRRIAGRPLAEFVGSGLLAGIDLPTLVIHAHDDKEVSADHAEDYAAAGEHVQLRWADGLGHRRILAGREVVEQAVDFVAAPGPALDRPLRAAE